MLWLKESKYALFLWRPAPEIAGRLWKLPSRYAAFAADERPPDADMESLHWVPLSCLLLPPRNTVDDLSDRLQDLAVSGADASSAGVAAEAKITSPPSSPLAGSADAAPLSPERAPWRTPVERATAADVSTPTSAATDGSSFTLSPVSATAGSPSARPRMQWRDVAGDGADSAVEGFLVRELERPLVQEAIRRFAAEPP